jgi:hypothetical protein
VQGAVKANLGTDNERLVQFNVAPIRARGPRKAKAVPPPEGVAVVAEPASEGPPAVEAEEKK